MPNLPAQTGKAEKHTEKEALVRVPQEIAAEPQKKLADMPLAVLVSTCWRV